MWCMSTFEKNKLRKFFSCLLFLTSTMTQTVFATYMGVSKKTVEAWESSRTHPTGPVFRLLDILNSDEIEETEYIVVKN